MNRLHDVDLKLIRTFVTIVRCGGFGAAQSSLNLSQSSISENMSQLESRLGVRLCERGRKGFLVTQEGRNIYNAAIDLFSAIDDFVLRSQESKGPLAGELRLGFCDNIVTDAASPVQSVIKDFLGKSPDITIKIEILSPDQLQAKLVAGDLHVAIGPFISRVNCIEYNNLYRELDALYCSKDHPVLSDLSPDQSSIDLSATHIVARNFMREKDMHEFGMPKAFVDNIEAQLMLILSSHYIGFLPKHYAIGWVEQGDLVCLKENDDKFFTDIQVAFKPDSLDRALIKFFLKLLAV